MTPDRPLRILVVDDEEIVRQTIGDFLVATGYRVDGVTSGHVALDALKVSEYDLAVVDVGLPDMDGLSLLKKIRADHPDVPVIMITGHQDLEVSVNALELGATRFLLKPIGLFELEAVLREAVGKR